MMAGGRTAVRTCARCQEPVAPGTGRLVGVDQGTTASPDILIHKRSCEPVYVRRSQG